MEGIIKEALIKVVNGGSSDKVLFVENLPKKLLYFKAPARKPHVVNGYATEVDIVIEGQYVDELHEGISRSINGDGAFVFDMHINSSQERFKDLNDYVTRNLPKDHERVKFVNYAQDPSDMRSNPIPRNEIPRACLPCVELVTSNPPREASVPVSPPASSAAQEQASHTLTEEEMKEYQEMKRKKEEARERMAKARASK